MTLFDLTFLAVVCGSLGGLALAAFLLITRRWRPALLLGAGMLATWFVYGVVLVGVSLTSPARVLAVGEDRCYDDWCIAVVDSQAEPVGSKTSLSVTLRLSNRARRVAQRENGLIVYVLDDAGRRYDPLVDTATMPFSTVLQPGEELLTVRVFDLPAGAQDLVLVLDRVGWDRVPGVFIIGDDSSWLHAPARVQLPDP